MVVAAQALEEGLQADLVRRSAAVRGGDRIGSPAAIDGRFRLQSAQCCSVPGVRGGKADPPRGRFIKGHEEEIRS